MRELADEEAAGSSPRGRGKLSVDPELGDRVGLIPAWAGKTEVAKCHGLKIQAHPRVGGENETSPDAQHRAGGSSPRGRGKLARTKRRCGRERLIPAWAGKTREFTDSPGVWGAHPRVGGENRNYPNYRPRSLGSSPRGRGKRRRLNGCPANRGLIPAWAGKTFVNTYKLRREQAHPRVGGENPLVLILLFLPQGSSPRGRGKLIVVAMGIGLGGLIPAWAGKTRVRCPLVAGRAAHPRVGGENLEQSTGAIEAVGSSPRGRGKPAWGLRSLRAWRLIPAWAGKTTGTARAAVHRQAHPRVGGENSSLVATPTSAAGSSPRGRGKQNASPTGRVLKGLIPAWAGKTLVRRLGGHQAKAHPRVGGENAVEVDPAVVRVGSSPRGRGKPSWWAGELARRGLIPAWAGKTAHATDWSNQDQAHPRVGGENRVACGLLPALGGSSPRGRGKPA